MEKSKLLTFAVIGLLLLNLGTLGFLYWNAPKNNKPSRNADGPKNRIIERLHFDQSQQNDYSMLIELHKTEINAQDETIKNTKNQLYALLSQDDLNVSKKDSLLAVMASTQKEIEAIHFKHFESIKKLCRNDQINDFKELTEELGTMFSMGRPRPDRPRP